MDLETRRNVGKLLYDFLDAATVAYYAFAEAEGPNGTPELLEEAYRAKDVRTQTICKLMGVLAELGIYDLNEGHAAVFICGWRE